MLPLTATLNLLPLGIEVNHDFLRSAKQKVAGSSLAFDQFFSEWMLTKSQRDAHNPPFTFFGTMRLTYRRLQKKYEKISEKLFPQFLVF